MKPFNLNIAVIVALIVLVASHATFIKYRMSHVHLLVLVLADVQTASNYLRFAIQHCRYG